MEDYFGYIILFSHCLDVFPENVRDAIQKGKAVTLDVGTPMAFIGAAATFGVARLLKEGMQ